MKRRYSIGLVDVLLPQCRQLVAQDVKHEPCIQFGIVDVARLQPPVVVVFDKMVVRVARKRERVQPERINRRSERIRQTRPQRHQVRQVMPDYVVTKQVRGAGQGIFQPIESCLEITLGCAYRRPGIIVDGGKCEHFRSCWIDFEVNRNATLQKGLRLFDHTAGQFRAGHPIIRPNMDEIFE